MNHLTTKSTAMAPRSSLVALEITNQQRLEILRCLREDFPLSAVLIRDNMRRNLGFTFREHRRGFEVWHYVDFFTPEASSWFLMRFSEILNDPKLEW
jgi:hypothetical protein